MGCLSKGLALLLILTMVISSLALLMVKPANAQPVPTPSVPQFTLKFVKATYDVTTVNPYNGSIQTQQIVNNSIEIVIENQPFNYQNNGSNYQIYFNIRARPHFSENWYLELNPIVNETSSPPDSNGIYSYALYLSSNSSIQSDTSNTTITLSLANVALGYDVEDLEGRAFMDSVPTNGQIDFQVEAFVGHDSEEWVVPYSIDPFIPAEPAHYAPAVAYDAQSGWSNTQTITLGKSSSSPTGSVPEFSSLAILPLLLSLFFVAVIVRHKRAKQ